jgi:hypothetical protein
MSARMTPRARRRAPGDGEPAPPLSEGEYDDRVNGGAREDERDAARVVWLFRWRAPPIVLFNSYRQPGAVREHEICDAFATAKISGIRQRDTNGRNPSSKLPVAEPPCRSPPRWPSAGRRNSRSQLGIYYWPRTGDQAP